VTANVAVLEVSVVRVNCCSDEVYKLHSAAEYRQVVLSTLMQL